MSERMVRKGNCVKEESGRREDLHRGHRELRVHREEGKSIRVKEYKSAKVQVHLWRTGWEALGFGRTMSSGRRRKRKAV